MWFGAPSLFPPQPPTPPFPIPHFSREFDRIDSDGLPHVGSVVWPSQHFYSTKDMLTGKFKPHKLKGEEIAYVDQVREAFWGGGGQGDM